MFEKISGFFKRFSRRRHRQSGETTIMNGKEPGVDDFGLDEGFGDMGDLGAPSMGDEVGFETDGGFSDAGLGTAEADITTGGSDFDARTISDEISGVGTGLDSDSVEAGAGALGGFGEEADAMPFDEGMIEARPASGKKRLITMVVVAVVAIAVGAAFQIFAWPIVGKMLGGQANEVKVDPQIVLTTEQKRNAKLKKELKDFEAVGKPAQAKAAQTELASKRDAQGPLDQVEQAYEAKKTEGAEYDSLIAKVDELGNEISATRAEVRKVESQIDDARVRVLRVREETEKEFERFRLELIRAEFSQRLLIELQREDFESFSQEIAAFERELSHLKLPATAVSSETVPTTEGS